MSFFSRSNPMCQIIFIFNHQSISCKKVSNRIEIESTLSTHAFDHLTFIANYKFIFIKKNTKNYAKIRKKENSKKFNYISIERIVFK